MKTGMKVSFVFGIFALMALNVVNSKMNSESAITLQGIERAFATEEGGGSNDCYTQVVDNNNYIDGCKIDYFDCWEGSSVDECLKGFTIYCEGEGYEPHYVTLNC